MFLIVAQRPGGWELVHSTFDSTGPGGGQIIARGTRPAMTELADRIKCHKDTVVIEPFRPTPPVRMAHCAADWL